jgi:hypothetical protein
MAVGLSNWRDTYISINARWNRVYAQISMFPSYSTGNMFLEDGTRYLDVHEIKSNLVITIV